MDDDLGPWGEAEVRQAEVRAYAEAELAGPLKGKLVRKSQAVAMTIALFTGAITLVLLDSPYGLPACSAVAVHVAYMLYQDRTEPLRVTLGLEIAAGFSSRSAIVEDLWHAISRRIRFLALLRTSTLVVLTIIVVCLIIP